MVLNFFPGSVIKNWSKIEQFVKDVTFLQAWVTFRMSLLQRKNGKQRNQFYQGRPVVLLQFQLFKMRRIEISRDNSIKRSVCLNFIDPATCNTCC